jgi:hypothetical protein
MKRTYLGSNLRNTSERSICRKEYFDEKTKEFYELKLGQLTIEEYVNKFLDLLRYVPYIKA